MLASLHLRAAARAAHWAVAFAGLGLALLVGCSDRDRAPASKEPRPVCVKVAIVRETQVSVPLVAPGQVSAFSSVAIRSQASGELERVHFNEGDRIQAGDLLFTIDPKPFETSLAEAKAGLERDLALQKTAESEQQADRLLFKSKIISQQNYNESASDAESLKSALQADRAMLAEAQQGLSNCYIRSPISGRAGLLQVSAGNVVTGPESVLVTVNQTQPIYVDISVPERHLSEIRRRLAAGHLRVEVWLPNQEAACAQGQATALDNQVDSDRHTILLRAVFPNQDELLWPGQQVSARLDFTTLTNAIVVPGQALQTNAQGRFAFVLNSQRRLERRPVELAGSAPGGLVWVTGLRPGEQVVAASREPLAVGARAQVEQ